MCHTHIILITSLMDSAITETYLRYFLVKFQHSRGEIKDLLIKFYFLLLYVYLSLLRDLLLFERRFWLGQIIYYYLNVHGKIIIFFLSLRLLLPIFSERCGSYLV